MGELSSFTISSVLSAVVAAFFIYKQLGYFRRTYADTLRYKDFFSKEGDYETQHTATERDGKKVVVVDKMLLKNVASTSAELHPLIEDINDYLDSCKGTATFSIIQNKTERRISKMYDKATAKASFPTHYGLMGTFLGVFMGLGAFLLISMNNEEGITDESIHSLILGVLVSMSTSFIGLVLSTMSNNRISNAKSKVDEDKNLFYEFVQNKLMPSVDVSLSEALGKLHETVTQFEPSFSHVIDGFKETFNECTRAFDQGFRDSVSEMVEAVKTMSRNINQVDRNVNLLEELLDRLSGDEWLTYMRQFADATDHFKSITQSLNDFERARRMMLAATQETLNMQKAYNDSLEIPREVATQINTILQRVVRFEESINALGTNLAATQMFGNTAIEEINNQISAIKKKHQVAERYIETADNKLEMFFDSQLIELKRMETNYTEALATLVANYVQLVQRHQEEVGKRHEAFKEAIDEKFELSGVRDELGQLKKIPVIEDSIDSIKKEQAQAKKQHEDILRQEQAGFQQVSATILRESKNIEKTVKDTEKDQGRSWSLFGRNKKE